MPYMYIHCTQVSEISLMWNKSLTIGIAAPKAFVVQGSLTILFSKNLLQNVGKDLIANENE